MKAKLFVVLSLLALTALLVGAVSAQGPGLQSPPRMPPAASAAGGLTADPQPRMAEGLRSSPVMFIENVGQFAEGARFQVRGSDRILWLADDGLWMTVLEKPSSPLPARSSLTPSPEFGGDRDEGLLPSPSGRGAGGEGKGVHLKLTFPGANPHPRLEPFNRLQTSVNYFIGNDPAQWRTNVPVWGGVRYVDLYPGVDLELTGEGGRVVPRLVCRANCPSVLQDVRLRVEGAERVALLSSAGGEGLLPSPSGRGAGGEGLRLTTAVGEFTLPLLQVVAADGTPLALAEARPAVAGSEVTAPFSSAPPLSLAASPQDNPNDLLYATFLGGGDSDSGSAIAVDGSGAAYVTGGTSSSNFPTTPGAFDTSYNGGNRDAFVAKLNASGSNLLYATFLGGSGYDWGSAIAVDGSGAAYVTGSTESSDFPTMPGAFDTSYNGGDRDAFVAKLNASGSNLLYATFLGGGDGDWGSAIAVDGSEAAYVMGYTTSSDFPTTPGAFDTSYNGYEDAFVAKLNASGSGLLYATFLGGSNYDQGYAIAVDRSGAAYVTGQTKSSGFPTTAGAFDTSSNGESDAFVAKLNPDGAALSYATFLGGSGNDWGMDIAVDGSGAAYVTGRAYSSDFPTTSGAFDTSFNGGYSDAFVAKLNPDGAALSYATFLGGSTFDWGNGIAVDGSGAAYVTGQTFSSDFPTTPGAFDTSFNGGYSDAFVAKLNPDGAALSYATFLGGGSSHDEGSAIAVDGSGAAYVMGWTSSSDFPTTPGAFDTSFNGGDRDAFVAKLALQHRIYLPLVLRGQ